MLPCIFQLDVQLENVSLESPKTKILTKNVIHKKNSDFALYSCAMSTSLHERIHARRDGGCRGCSLRARDFMRAERV